MEDKLKINANFEILYETLVVKIATFCVLGSNIGILLRTKVSLFGYDSKNIPVRGIAVQNLHVRGNRVKPRETLRVLGSNIGFLGRKPPC